MFSHEEPYRRKRSRDQSANEESEQQPSPKKRKATSQYYPPQFWDALSKVTLTRKALKEIDRRTEERNTTRTVRTEKKTTRLLRSDTRRLAYFASNGGPDLSNLRGYADLPSAPATMSQSSSRTGKRTRDSGLPSSKATTKTSTTGPYDPQFEQMLIDRRIYPDGYRTLGGSRPPKPGNLDEIRQNLAQTRPSLSPSAFSEGAFEDFQDMNRRAKSESKTMTSVIPIVAGSKDGQYESEENLQFSNLEKLDPNLKVPQPDKYYGARPSQVDERVRGDLSKYIVPSTESSLPVAPNFFMEAKGRSGRSDVLQRQAMYDGAIAARGMFQLQNYGSMVPVYDGNAYSIASSYHPGEGTLKMYTTHPRQSVSGQTEYYMTQLDGYQMTGNIDTFRRGAAAYRNSREWTRERRDQFIADANTAALRMSNEVASVSQTESRAEASPTSAEGSFSSETSVDELALDSQSSAKRRRDTTSQ